MCVYGISTDSFVNRRCVEQFSLECISGNIERVVESLHNFLLTSIDYRWSVRTQNPNCPGDFVFEILEKD